MDGRAFFREVYLRSEPSIDITTAEGPINPSDHRLELAEYDKILKEYDVQPGTDLYLACNMLILNKGPQLVY